MQLAGVQFAAENGAQTPIQATVRLLRMAVAVIFQKALNQSKLTELK